MTDNQDINKWIDLHKDKIESTAEALAVEDILADKIAEMREQERRNALNIDPREDVRLNYFKGLKIKPHSKEILYPTQSLKAKTRDIKKEIERNYGSKDSVWFSNKANGPDFNDKTQKWLHDLSESNPIYTEDYKPLPVGQEPIRNDEVVKMDQIYDNQLASNDALYTNKLDNSSYKQLPKAKPAPMYKWSPKIEKQDNTIPKKNNFFNKLVSKMQKVKYSPITAQGAGTDEIEVDSSDTDISLGETTDYSLTESVSTVALGLVIAGVLYKLSRR
jgi:hypothetical protein